MNRYVSVGAAFLAAVLIVVGIVAVSPGDGASGATPAEDSVVSEPPI